MKNKNLFEEVKKINLPLGEFALFGSAPLGIRGLKECHDIDIIVTEDVYDFYKNKEKWAIKKMEDEDVEYLRRGNVELWSSWGPGDWNIKELIAEAEEIDGLPFVRIERVLEWKKINGREKDKEDIRRIERFLRAPSGPA